MQNSCKYCREETARRGYTYCSNQCQMDFQYKKYIFDWLDGKIDGGLSTGLVSRHIKRYLRENNQDSCQDCGWSVVSVHTKKVPLEVEHIDGNYKNNKVDNLKLICPNCHSLTSTYKGLNRGKGRAWRMPS